MTRVMYILCDCQRGRLAFCFLVLKNDIWLKKDNPILLQ